MGCSPNRDCLGVGVPLCELAGPTLRSRGLARNVYKSAQFSWKSGPAMRVGGLRGPRSGQLAGVRGLVCVSGLCRGTRGGMSLIFSSGLVAYLGGGASSVLREGWGQKGSRLCELAGPPGGPDRVRHLASGMPKSGRDRVMTGGRGLPPHIEGSGPDRFRPDGGTPVKHNMSIEGPIVSGPRAG